MSEEKLATLLSFFKALADETRLRILGLVGSREFSVQELAATLAVREPTVSHHLARLKELGLVRMRAEGNVHLYHLDVESLHALSRDVLTPETLTSAAAEGLDLDVFDRKVLANYLVDGRLEVIPAQRKKREVVLRWLAALFEPDRRYPEAEVNEIIGRHHDDFATLRRELIMARLLQREEGVYWRP